jgi:hypothetical protein
MRGERIKGARPPLIRASLLQKVGMNVDFGTELLDISVQECGWKSIILLKVSHSSPYCLSHKCNINLYTIQILLLGDPRRKYDVSATEPNRVMLFGEKVDIYCENHTEHTNTRANNN